MYSTPTKAYAECKKMCPGPENCEVNGALYYQPLEEPYGPYLFLCPVYEKYRKQIEIEKSVMDVIPKKFWNKSFGNYVANTKDTRTALKLSKKYVEKTVWKGGGNLIFYGPYGTGKTHLASAIIRKAIENGANGAFVTASMLSSGDFTEMRKRFKALREIELLVIDDFTNEADHGFVGKELFNLVNYRYECELGMVLTTNLEPEDLAESLGGRIFDRLTERTVIIKIMGGSYRKQKRKKYIEWVREE